MSVSKPLMLGFGILSCLLAAPSVQGGESKLIPQISIKETYNDNINFSTSKEKDDMIFNITPLIRWNYQTEKTRTTASAEANILKYSKEKNLDKVNQKYNLTHNFRATELFGLNLNGSLIKDTTLDTEKEETGLVLKRSDRDFYNITPGISLYLTEKTGLNLSIGYSRAEYEDPEYSDRNIYDGTLELVHTLSEEGATVSAQGGYERYDYETSYYDVGDYRLHRTSNVDNYSLHLGLTYPFTERLKLTAWGGARYTKSEYEDQWEPVSWWLNPVKKTESDRNWGGLGYLALNMAFTDGSVSVSISRDVMPSGRGETIERDRATLSIDYSLAEFITGRFSGSWSRSRSESQYKDTDEQLYNLRPSLRWQIMEHGKAELSYQYSMIEYMDTGTNAERNTIFLSFTIYWEKLI